MIWKTAHVLDEAKVARNCIARHLKDPDAMQEVAMAPNTTTIAIVGGGPKGMYALERLLNDLTASSENANIHILWINESKDFGSGNNYQVDQPDYLLINYCIGNIDAWNREILNANIPSQPTLLDWIKTYRNNDAAVRPTDYASRALVGCYLQSMLQHILDSVPPHVSISLVQGKVEDIRYAADFSIKLHASSTLLKSEYLLLATGHCYENSSLISAYAVQSELRGHYFKSAYPVKKLNMIPAQADVAVVGLGLTFIDVVLHLTEGRGGQFTDDGSYLPSGNEPRVYAFSRNNVPILPRGPIYGNGRYQLRPATIDQLQSFQLVKKERAIDFESDLYPLLAEEAKYAYYSTLLQNADEQVVAHHIATLSADDIFSLDQLLFPASISDHEAMLKLLRDTIAYAESGELQAPLLAASAVWREATKWVGELYQYAGFTGESQAAFDSRFFGAFCRTSFGPPIANMKKVLALAEAGILRFPATDSPTINYKNDEATFEIKGDSNSFTCSYLVDARIGRSNLAKKNAPLYSALYQAGLVSDFTNEEYQPGCVAMDTLGRTTSSPNGSNPPLFFYGTPTEGVLLDNDSLSRKRNDTGSSWSKFVVNDLLSLQKNNIHEAYSEG